MKTISYRHKTLHLSAMGAAIPHLLQLATSLPDILPYAPEEIQTEVLTGTVEVQDEVIPDDEDEEISLRTRRKSTLSVVIKIGDGIDEGARTGKGRRKKSKAGEGKGPHRAGGKSSKGQLQHTDAPAPQENQIAGPSNTEAIVVREEDLDDE